jgi:Pyruvate/2-oxoacid:ferredoxin oxidoreductase gamma subunit
VDLDLVSKVSESARGIVYRVPTTKIAAEEFKKTLVANMVMLGAVASITGVVRLASLKRSVEELAPKGYDMDEPILPIIPAHVMCRSVSE